ncbi:pyridoxamine 5'-phosphate oxidase family protein [Amycolatopsis taiwanensis]|uniref:pyridoxamine 5'-phosphate oxidase family protein n=1 Tax=Amycolatopsis taiwanensis TaxID=342230 RepID=UPI0004810A7D|nr:pyridoxamine 5'-phosphate oxidase family protein [Amycolatopsis taiwanensis]
MAEPRDRATRKADALAMLAAEVDVWVATASSTGAPHLIPLSLAWADERVIIAIPKSSVTAHNLGETGAARLAVGPTGDVVMIDAVVDKAASAAEDAALAETFAAHADWDPRRDPTYIYFVLRPVRVQAWREANEIAGRTLMRNGGWQI